MKKRSVLCAILFGILSCIPFEFVSLFPHIPEIESLSVFLFALFVGGTLSVFPIAYKTDNIKVAIIKYIAVNLSFYLFVGILGKLNVSALLYQIFNIAPMTNNDFAEGLILAFYIVAIRIIQIIAMIGLLIRNAYLKRRRG